MQLVFHVAQLPRLALPDPRLDVGFIHTQHLSVAFSQLLAGAEVPLHQHLHETIDIVEEGSLLMTIGQDTVALEAGMLARIPSHMPHSAKAMTDCKVINVFYPVRADFKEPPPSTVAQGETL